jgi:hypothetical protein
MTNVMGAVFVGIDVSACMLVVALESTTSRAANGASFPTPQPGTRS